MQKLFLTISFLLFLATYGQNAKVAENYMDQGEIEKAKATYEKLYERKPNNSKIAVGLAKAYLELEEYEPAQKTLTRYLQKRNQPAVMITLAHIYTVEGKDEQAEIWYDKAIQLIDKNPYYAFSIGKKLEEYGKLDKAIKAYEKGNEIRPSINFKVKLARIYGEKGNLQKMFSNYIDLILERANYYGVIKRNFEGYIVENPMNEANRVFRKLLIKNIQQEPKVILNEMLSWLYIQEKQYIKAFAQQKAVTMRSDASFQSLINIGKIAEEEGYEQDALKIYKKIIDDKVAQRGKIEATTALMKLKVKTAEPTEFAEIKADYNKYLNKFGRNPDTDKMQQDYARFLAFQLDKIDEAKQIISDLLDKNLYRFSKGSAKILLADILVLEESFNQALIYYTQVEKLLPNNKLGQKAKFKVAKTSYYKGDFKWAVTQLDVLKKATSQLIANDALELALHIKDNGLRDSTQTALQQVAQADLRLFQKRVVSAEKQLAETLEEFPDHDIIDEVHFRLAEIYQQQGKYEQAIDALKKIFNNFPNSILIDNAYFKLAEILQYELDQKQEAQDYYGKILFDHQDSIFYVEAQQQYRKLRGDQEIN